MLTFDPAKRITIEQALAHPYMDKLHFVDDEPTGDPVADFDFDFELYSLKIPEYKQLIYEEILLYHDQSEIDKYFANKKSHPKGVLCQRFGKDRLRTMYKSDQTIIAQITSQKKK